MEKFKLAIIATLVSASCAMTSPAAAFSLGAALSDISKSTLMASAAAPVASSGFPIGRTAATHCAAFACPEETVSNSTRFAIYRATPDADIFTGSIPVDLKVGVRGGRYPAFNLGLGTQTIWPSLLRVDAPLTAAVAKAHDVPAFIDI